MANQNTRKPPLWLKGARYAFLAFVLFIFVFGYQTSVFYTDWQWFKELQHPEVFSTVLSTRLVMFGGFGLLFFLFCFSNLWLSRKLNAGRTRTKLYDTERELIRALAQAESGWVVIGGTVLIAFILG